MSDVPRRDFLAGAAALAAAATSTLGGTGNAQGGDTSFMNNVPDPILAGKELPTFKFALDKSTGKVIGKATARKPRSSSCRSPKGSPVFQ